MSHRLGKTSCTTLHVSVKSGDILDVQFNEAMDEVFLTGPAKIVYKGSFTIE